MMDEVSAEELTFSTESIPNNDPLRNEANDVTGGEGGQPQQNYRPYFISIQKMVLYETRNVSSKCNQIKI